MTVVYAIGGLNPDVNPSPFVWKVMLSLRHKGIQFEVKGLKYREIRFKVSELTGGKWDRIPLVVYNDGTQMYDSDQIANQLELKYPEEAKLFPNGDNFFTLMKHSIRAITYPLFMLSLPNFITSFEPEDLVAFRFAQSEDHSDPLENLIEKVDEVEGLKRIQVAIKPFVDVLLISKYLEGEQVTYSDYYLFSYFQLLNVMDTTRLQKVLKTDETQTLKRWFDSISELYDGMAKNANKI